MDDKQSIIDYLEENKEKYQYSYGIVADTNLPPFCNV